MKNAITAKRLREAMSDASLTAQELSNRSGVSKSSISQYVNGTYEPGNLSALKLAKVLGVSPMWLMNIDGFEKYQDVIVNGPSVDDSKEVANAYKNLSPEMKNAIRRMLGLDEIK